MSSCHHASFRLVRHLFDHSEPRGEAATSVMLAILRHRRSKRNSLQLIADFQAKLPRDLVTAPGSLVVTNSHDCTTWQLLDIDLFL